jgi:putative sigma-54 modulation protein
LPARGRQSEGTIQFSFKECTTVQVNISARHGHLSDATREKITAKVEKLARLFERLLAIEVTIDLEHEQAPSVDIRVSAEHKHDFVATEQAANLMAAVDGVIHKLEQQLRKYKEKVQDHHRTPARHGEATLEEEPPAL